MTEIDLNALASSDLGFTVDDEDDDDPVLLDHDGNPNGAGLKPGATRRE